MDQAKNPESAPEMADTRYDVAEKFVYGASYETNELAQLPPLLEGVRVFIDVGASLGPYTFCADRTLRDADIYSIEANPQTYARLAKLCAKSQSTNRLHPIHAAAASERGKIDFFIPSAKSSRLPLTSSLFQNQQITDDWEKVLVDCITLDDLCRDLSPDFLKMDIEGAEFRALQGAARVLESGKCRFLVEVHPWGDPTIGKRPDDIFKLFYSYGYDFRRVARHWLFEKKPRLWAVRFLKLKAIVFIHRCLPLKEFLKKVVVWFDSLKRRRGLSRQKN
jgi:FkbM family methyltransferase